MTNGFLDKAYDVSGVDQTRQMYNDWAASYEAEVRENGYVTPKRVARALAKKTTNLTQPVLDFGCGTGLSGLALRAAGFDTLDGIDLSSEMLGQARKKGIYRALFLADSDQDLPVKAGQYALITAIGVIGAGAAPLDTFDIIMRMLPAKGLFSWSFNDHTLEDPSYEARVNEWLDCGQARLLSSDYGDHLPGKNMKSKVYVIEKS